MPHYDQKYNYEPLQFYPHMGPKDAHIWDQFVHHNPGRFDIVYYDMRVGTPEHPPNDLPRNVQDAWNDLCRGRVDVVAQDQKNIYVIEVKPRARGEALGQALNNATLYEEDHDPVLPVIPVVITDIILPNTVRVANRINVAIASPASGL